jgi:hypothetical protein
MVINRAEVKAPEDGEITGKATPAVNVVVAETLAG